MKRSTFINKLDTASRFIGVPGRGYPDSFYKVYVQPKPGAKMYCFESARPIENDLPMWCASSYNWNKIMEIYPDAVIGNLVDIVNHKYWVEEKPAIGMLFDRANAIIMREKPIKHGLWQYHSNNETLVYHSPNSYDYDVDLEQGTCVSWIRHLRETKVWATNECIADFDWCLSEIKDIKPTLPIFMNVKKS